MLIKKKALKFYSQCGEEYIAELVRVKCPDKKELEEYAGQILHENELCHYKKIKTAYRKQEFLLGRIAAKVALGEILAAENNEIEISNGIFSQPIVCVGNQNISKITISHSHDTGMALAYSEKLKIGIDFEAAEKKKTDIYQTLSWCAKEALAKALEIGLYNCEIFEIQDICEMDFFYIFSFKHFHQFQCIAFLYDGHILTLAYPKSLETDYHYLMKFLITDT